MVKIKMLERYRSLADGVSRAVEDRRPMDQVAKNLGSAISGSILDWIMQ